MSILCFARHLLKGYINIKMRSTLTQTLNQEDIALLKKNFPLGICAIDVETTGLSPSQHEIIEFAGVKIDKTGAVSHLQLLIKPQDEILEHSSLIHGINNGMVQEAPLFVDCAHHILGFIADTTLLAHNAIYDIGFLIKELSKIGKPIPENQVVDSILISRTLFKNKKIKPDNFKLSTISSYFDFSFTHHHALDDAFISLAIYSKCLAIEDEKIIPSKRIQLSTLGKMSELKLDIPLGKKKVVDLIKKSIASQEKVEIIYNGGKHKKKWRGIKPIAILPTTMGANLYAQCLIESSPKYFNIAKITEIKLGNEHEK